MINSRWNRLCSFTFVIHTRLLMLTDTTRLLQKSPKKKVHNKKNYNAYMHRTWKLVYKGNALVYICSSFYVGCNVRNRSQRRPTVSGVKQIMLWVVFLNRIFTLGVIAIEFYSHFTTYRYLWSQDEGSRQPFSWRNRSGLNIHGSVHSFSSWCTFQWLP